MIWWSVLYLQFFLYLWMVSCFVSVNHNMYYHTLEAQSSFEKKSCAASVFFQWRCQDDGHKAYVAHQCRLRAMYVLYRTGWWWAVRVVWPPGGRCCAISWTPLTTSQVSPPWSYYSFKFMTIKVCHSFFAECPRYILDPERTSKLHNSSVNYAKSPLIAISGIKPTLYQWLLSYSDCRLLSLTG